MTNPTTSTRTLYLITDLNENHRGFIVAASRDEGYRLLTADTLEENDPWSMTEAEVRELVLCPLRPATKEDLDMDCRAYQFLPDVLNRSGLVYECFGPGNHFTYA